MVAKKQKGKRQNFFSSSSLKEGTLLDNKSDENLSATKKFITQNESEAQIELTKEGEIFLKQKKLESTEPPVLIEEFSSKFDLTPLNPSTFIKPNPEILTNYKKIKYATFINDSLWLFIEGKCIKLDIGFNEELSFPVDADFLYFEPLIIGNFVYFVSSKKILKYDIEKKEKKIFNTSFIPSSQLFENKGKFFLIIDFNKIISLNNEFKEEWSFSAENYSLNTPVFDENNIFITSTDGFLYQLDLNGELKWTYNTKNHISSSPIVCDDFIATTSINGKFHLISKNKKEMLTTIDTGFAVTETPLFFDNKFFVFNRKFIYEMNETGIKNIAQINDSVENIIQIDKYIGVITNKDNLLILSTDFSQCTIINKIHQKPFMVYNYLFAINTEGFLIKTEI